MNQLKNITTRRNKTHSIHKNISLLATKRTGTINFFDPVKGIGSVKDSSSQHSYIVYAHELPCTLLARDYVSFELETTVPGGLVARSVKKMD